MKITGTHLGVLLILVFFTAQYAMADGIVFKFKNPSFSGQGTSAHYLTIENQEKSRRDKIKEDIQAAIEKAEREANNTTQAKFLRNLESRIYAQIAKQLVDNMFGNTESATSGFFEIEGNSITYETIIGGGPDVEGLGLMVEGTDGHLYYGDEIPDQIRPIQSIDLSKVEQ